ncbi:MAG TPA: hypothetical protein DEO88_04965 [Syntrophobacteraceae bacterium]|nr:hypothetical protein [Syntrophobacteraceae bacterium]
MKQSIAEPFRIDDLGFKPCFSAPSLPTFVGLVIGWVLTVGKRTVSQVILTMGLQESRHFASIYRFLGKGRWQIDLVSCLLFKLLVKCLVPLGSVIQVVLDDTLNKHRGPCICGAGWQHDGSASHPGQKTGYGLCFVIIGLAVRLPGISDRVFCLPFGARLWWPRKAKVRPTGPNKTKPKLAVELITLTRSWLEDGQIMRVVHDSAYCCETVIKGRPKDVHITGRIRKDSALFDIPEIPMVRGRGRPRKKGHRLPTPADMFADRSLAWTEIKVICYGKERTVLVYQLSALWYNSAGEEPLNLVLSRDPTGKCQDTVFFDTDPLATAGEIIERYAARWSIEVTNRETKHLLGAADPQCRREDSVIRAPMFAYWAYSFVILWFVEQFHTAKDLVADPPPWYRRKINYTFSDMLAAARRSHFSSRIFEEARDSHKLPNNRKSRCPHGADLTQSAKL